MNGEGKKHELSADVTALRTFSGKSSQHILLPQHRKLLANHSISFRCAILNQECTTSDDEPRSWLREYLDMHERLRETDQCDPSCEGRSEARRAVRRPPWRLFATMGSIFGSRVDCELRIMCVRHSMKSKYYSAKEGPETRN